MNISDIISIATGSLLFISEVLPFIPYIGNGLLHSLFLSSKTVNNSKVTHQPQESLEDLEKKLEIINKQIEEYKKYIS